MKSRAEIDELTDNKIKSSEMVGRSVSYIENNIIYTEDNPFVFADIVSFLASETYKDGYNDGHKAGQGHEKWANKSTENLNELALTIDEEMTKTCFYQKIGDHSQEISNMELTLKKAKKQLIELVLSHYCHEKTEFKETIDE